jgi:hypothetical protein
MALTPTFDPQSHDSECFIRDCFKISPELAENFPNSCRVSLAAKPFLSSQSQFVCKNYPRLEFAVKIRRTTPITALHEEERCI